MRQIRIFGLMFAVVLVAGACSGQTDQAAQNEAGFSSASEADTAASYALVDFGFQGPTTVKGPNVYITAQNKGSQTHELVVQDASGKVAGEIEDIAPGAEGKPLPLVLAPGSYTLLCELKTPEGKVHKDLGMQATLTVS